MRRLLWIGDAGCETGFARSTHKILETVYREWDVHVLGINYRGDPHDYPYPIYMAQRYPGDLFGIRRLQEMLQKVKPDLIVVQNDPWNFPSYMKRLGETPVVGIVAVDGKNCRGRSLNGLKHAIFWTDFGEKEAKRGGYVGTSSVIPLGVDTEIYYPAIGRLLVRSLVSLLNSLIHISLGMSIVISPVSVWI
jgi:D-inositol-3-phosphate glycosyltransferase